MLKITAFLVMAFVVGSVWSSCESCGRECTSSCGTRRFRACCFNYLRRKRAPHVAQLHNQHQDMKDSRLKLDLPLFPPQEEPSLQWLNNVPAREYQPYTLEDMFENDLD